MNISNKWLRIQGWPFQLGREDERPHPGVVLLRLRRHPDSGRSFGRNFRREVDFRPRNFDHFRFHSPDSAGSQVQLRRTCCRQNN